MKQKYLIFLLLVVLVGFGYIYSAIYLKNSTKKKIVNIEKKIRGLVEQLNSAKILQKKDAATAENFNAEDKDFNQLVDELKKFIEASITDKGTYSTEEINEFVRKMADLADSTKIAVIASTHNPITKEDKTSIDHQYNMELECTYLQLVKFLSVIESWDQIIIIQSLEIKPQSARSKQKQIDTSDIVENKNIETLYRVSLELTTLKIVKEKS
jgi:hypothetical protein